MKNYLVHWYDYCKSNYRNITAENISDAKKIAFKLMCDNAGDRLYNVDVYELKYTFECQGELNPHPQSHTASRASRDYYTGKKAKYEYINNETGEILTRAQALQQWREDYDGDDDTNGIPFAECFTKL